MKRTHLKEDIVLAVVVAALASIILYKVHGIKEPYRVVISDGKTIEGDGTGPYFCGRSHLIRVQFGYGKPIIVEMSYEGLWSDRSVAVNFEGAPWKDEDLVDAPPILQTKRYRVKFLVRFEEEYAEMGVGGRLGPNEIVIYLADVDTDEYFLEMFRLGPPNSPSEPPNPLYGEGRAELSREGEDAWVLDVDAWFKVKSLGVQPQETHYVRLSFKVTVELRPLII